MARQPSPMIELRDVAKRYATRFGMKEVLKPTTVTVPTGRNVALIGRNGAGKSTLLRIMSGTEKPDQGRVVRHVSTSWPMGFGGGFHQDLTGRENVRFIARIYGAPSRMVEEFVVGFAELGEYLDMPVRTYSAGMRAKLAFAASLSIDFQCYLIDEITAVGDQWFQRKCRAAFADLKNRANIVLVSHNLYMIRDYCDMGMVINGGQVEVYDSVDEAIRVYSSMRA